MFKKSTNSLLRISSRCYAAPGYRPKSFPKLTSSYYHNAGETGTTLTDITIDQAFLKNAQNHQTKTALIAHAENDFTLTFSQLEEKVSKLADGLFKLGLQPKARVAIWAPNIKEFYITQLAVSRAGMVLVTMNPLYTSKEASFTLDLAECDAVITPRGIATAGTAVQDYVKAINSMEKPPKLHILIEDSEILHQNFSFEEAKLPTIPFNQVLSSGDGNSTRLANVKNKSDDISYILFTSGTTGKPKAAATTHFSVVNGALGTSIRQGALSNEIVCLNVPLFHALGNICGSVVTAITGGNTLLLPYYGWNAKKSIEAIGSCGATYMYGTPTMYIDLINEVEINPKLKDNFSTLKTGLVAASIMPKEIFEKANASFDINTINFYGSTENSTVMIGCYLDDPVEKKLESIGRAYDNLELRIVGPNNETMPLNTPGELCTRGWALFTGYLKDDDKTKQAVDSGRWYHTGDLAEMDEEGYIKIVGRIKDMLIRGGANIYPTEIESVLLQHSDVLDAQVVAAPDARLGEVPAAYIRLSENAKNKSSGSVDEIIKNFKSHCGEHLAKSKIPKYWKIVESYPTTLSGKVKKFELRDRCREDFGIE